MFTVKNGRVYYENRPAYVRDIIIPETILKEIEYEDIGNAFAQHVVVDGMLIYVIKYKEDQSEELANLWHFAFQKLDKSYLYESKALYLGL